MIVFTDGSDTQGSTSFNDALNAINGRRVYTVGLGEDIEPEILEILGTSGFYYVNDINTLNTAFQEIADEINDYANSFYWLNYSSPKEGPNNHTLILEKVINPINSFVEGYFNSKDFFHPNSSNTSCFINASPEKPEGITSIEVPIGNHVTKLRVVTYLATVYPPNYIWHASGGVSWDYYDSEEPTNHTVWLNVNSNGAIWAEDTKNNVVSPIVSVLVY
jgi:hypothetical protein